MNIYAQRRATLARQMEAVGGGVALFNAAPERTRNSDTHHPYRHDSHQFYMCGFPEPDAVLAVVARPGAAPRSILFCRAKHAEREIWEGFRFGPEAAAEKFAIDSAHPIEEIDQHLPPLLANQHAVYYAHGADPEFDRKISTWLIAVQAMRRQGTTAPAAIFDVRTLVDEMRLRKDASEIDTMRRAAAISVAAHSRAMRVCQPGMFEYQIEAELLHEFKMRGSQSPAYGSIVAGGAGACVLHYVANDRRLIEGDLVLIDAGSELDGYA